MKFFDNSNMSTEYRVWEKKSLYVIMLSQVERKHGSSIAVEENGYKVCIN